MFVTPHDLGQVTLGRDFQLDLQPIIGSLLAGGSMRKVASRVIQEVEFRSQVSPTFRNQPFADDPDAVQGWYVDNRTMLAPKYATPSMGQQDQVAQLQAALTAITTPVTITSGAPPAPAASTLTFKDRVTRAALNFARPSFYVRTPGGIIPIEPYGAPDTDQTPKVIAGLVVLGLGLGFLTYKALKPCPKCLVEAKS